MAEVEDRQGFEVVGVWRAIVAFSQTLTGKGLGKKFFLKPCAIFSIRVILKVVVEIEP